MDNVDKLIDEFNEMSKIIKIKEDDLTIIRSARKALLNQICEMYAMTERTLAKRIGLSQSRISQLTDK